MRFVVRGCLSAVALAAVGCADGTVRPTGPSATAVSAAPSLSASPRRGDLHVTKECSEYRGRAGDFCTITSSNVKAIEVGSRVIYLQAEGTSSLDSDVVLDLPGRGNNKAFGHCLLDYATFAGECTFTGGTGKFSGFTATAKVSYLGDFDWGWDGTYGFNSRD